MDVATVREKKRGRAAMDMALVFGAIGSLAIVLLAGMPPLRSSTFSASDFKTLYASAACFARGQDAYSFANLEAVFRANGVVPPETWFAHAPVYPPTTLALLAPLTALRMTAAIWMALSGAAFLWALAVLALLRYATEELQFPVLWRVVLAGLCAASPLLAFSLTIGNVSLPVAALSILVFMRRRSGWAWGHGVLLAIAFLLKPHLAVWVAVALLLLRERRSRAVVAWAAGVVAAFAGCVAAGLACWGKFGMQAYGFVQMLRAEESSGASMSAGSHEALPVVAQITSLKSLVGFWTARPAVQSVASLLLLLLLAAILVWYSYRLRDPADASLMAAAWCAFGLLATYHRTHDAIVLLIAAPWVLSRIRTQPRQWPAWAVAGLYVLLSCGLELETISGWVSRLPFHSLGAFLLLRQSALAALLLLVVMVFVLGREETAASIEQKTSGAV